MPSKHLSGSTAQPPNVDMTHSWDVGCLSVSRARPEECEEDSSDDDYLPMTWTPPTSTLTIGSPTTLKKSVPTKHAVTFNIIFFDTYKDAGDQVKQFLA